MTAVDVVYRFGKPPNDLELKAIDSLREVYGIRKISFEEAESSVRVEYDATRMNEDSVAALLRRTGLDLGDKVQLV